MLAAIFYKYCLNKVLSSVHMSKVDEHKIELMLQIRHERSMTALVDQLKANLALDRENAASLYDEFIHNE